MRNFKKLTAVVVALALVLTTFVPAFAAYNAVNGDKALVLNKLDLYAGTSTTTFDPSLDTELTRGQGAVLLAKLFNMDSAAQALTDAEANAILKDFADASKVPTYAKKRLAYMVKNDIMSGSLNTSTNKLYIDADESLLGGQFATLILKQMGFTVESWKLAIDQLSKVEGAEGLAAYLSYAEKDLLRDQAVGIMYGSLTAEYSDGAATVIGKLVAAKPELKEEATKAGLLKDLAVESIAANTAKSFLVKFNNPVADADKVTFEVKRLTTAVSVTATWNEAKTEATLASTSNLAEATFTVRVLADAKEIAKNDISITAQKVAKIEITSPSVAVTVSNGVGYVNYRVYDQYNNDITTTAMANALTPQVGVGTSNITVKNGLLTITGANPALMTLQSLSVVLYDSNAGVTATKSLPVSTTVGTLSDFQFGSVDNVKLVEGDTTSVFYIPYTAKDMAGNETKDFDLVKGGLIDSNSNTTDIDLVVSLSSNVTAKVVKDPANSKNAAIEVKYVGTSNQVMDMPVTITAMTYGGISTSVQTTLSKAKAVDTITLMAPSETVAATETPEIPFEAYDKNGDKITSFTYINENTITSNGFSIVERADGTAKFVMDSVANKGIATLSANVVKSGKVSNILSINVQDKAKPTSLQFVQSGIVGAMEQGSSQKIEIGDDLKVYDQYDRLLSDDDVNKYFGANDGAGNDYYIVATANGNATVAGGATHVITSATDFTLAAANVAGGYATIEFELFADLAAGDVSKDTASTSVSVVATSDIKDYTINSSDKAIYSVKNNSSAITDREEEFAFNAKVYGLTSSGTKVLLAGTPIASASLSNGTDFVATTGSALAYNAVYVAAKELTGDKTSASTDLVVTVAHNNTVKPLKTTITSSTTAPAAKDINFEGADSDGIVDGADSFTAATAATNATFLLQKYNADTGVENTNKFYFEIKDSYGTEGMLFSDFQIAKIWDASTSSYVSSLSGVSVSNKGVLTTSSSLAKDDVIYVTAITNNGLSSTMKIVVQ